MQPDMILVAGLLLAGFSLIGIISAMSDGRSPRASAISVLIAGGLVIYALQTNPGGYSLHQIPDVFVRVFAQLIG